MRSMTGYGRGIAEKDGRKVTIELRSVNHRFSDYSMKFPRFLSACEDAVRKVCSDYIVRGHVDVFMMYENNRDDKAAASLDLPLAKQYLEIAKELESVGFVNDLTAARVMKMPDVVEVKEADENLDEIIALTVEATEEACKKLVEMREVEGEKLRVDLLTKLHNLEETVSFIEERAPLVSTVYAEKLKKRMTDYLGGIEIDQSKFLSEVCLYTDRVAIDEELTRLRTHFAHCKEIFEKDGSIGKTLDFTVQEMNREINTTGSKCSDILITEKVIAAKNELEKFREQVQNIE